MKNYEDAVRDVLNGSAQENALDFAAFLDSKGISLESLNDTMWRAGLGDECICYMHIDGAANMPGPWTVWPDGSYDSVPNCSTIDERTKDLAWAHVNICGSCGGACSPGMQKVIFGKQFDNVCNSVMAFCNPDAEGLKCLKELIEWKIMTSAN